MARVLVVDDDADVRELVVRWLSREGHRVLAVASGPAALDALDVNELPDVAVVDVALPGMDGVELLDRLRQRSPGLPAVFLTVLWSGHDVARMRGAGADYLPKPSSARGLCEAVGRLLADRDQAEAR